MFWEEPEFNGSELNPRQKLQLCLGAYLSDLLVADFRTAYAFDPTPRTGTGTEELGVGYRYR